MTLELDKNGAFDKLNNVQVPFTATSSQGEIADAIVAALKATGLGLNPVNVGSGLVHLGVDGTQNLAVTSQTIRNWAAITAIQDGQKFTVDDGAKLVTFEFDNNQRTEATTVRVPFTFASTYTQIADAIRPGHHQQQPGPGTDALGPRANPRGRHDAPRAGCHGHSLILTGLRRPAGVWLPVPHHGRACLRTPPPSNTPPPTTRPPRCTTARPSRSPAGRHAPSPSSSTATARRPPATRDPVYAGPVAGSIGRSLAMRIRNTDLGLFPYNAGYGGSSWTAMPPTPSIRCCPPEAVGQPGVPAAEAIPFVPDKTFTPHRSLRSRTPSISPVGLVVGVQARCRRHQVVVNGLANATGTAVKHVAADFEICRPISCNRTKPTATCGSRSSSGPVGLWRRPRALSDAPVRRRRSPRNRQRLLAGPDSRRQRRRPAQHDADGDDDENGVVFDPHTPLTPGHTFNFTVSIAAWAR